MWAVTNPRLHWQYPDEAVALMRDSLEANFSTKIAGLTRVFDLHSSMGLFADYLLHHFSGPMGLAPAVLAYIAHSQPRRRWNTPWSMCRA
jgi:hypothetical protein